MKMHKSAYLYLVALLMMSSVDGGQDAGPDSGSQADNGEPDEGGGCSCGKHETNSSLPAMVLFLGMVGLVIRRKL